MNTLLILEADTIVEDLYCIMTAHKANIEKFTVRALVKIMAESGVTAETVQGAVIPGVANVGTSRRLRK